MAPRSRIKGFDDTEPSPSPSARAFGSRSASPSPARLESTDLAGGSVKGKERAIIDVDSLDESDMDPDTCAICLADIWNKAEASPCHHNLFCFACLHTWCAMSRRCPLCNTTIDFIMTHVRSETDFQKHLLLPLASADAPTLQRPPNPPICPVEADIDVPARRQVSGREGRPRKQGMEWGKRHHRKVVLPEVEEDELALQRRKWIYRHKLYAKHVASNAYTRYQSFTPSQFSSSPERKSRVAKFARREFQVFPNVDVEWLVTYLLQIMCQLDLRSDNAIRLLSEFLGADQAEHFAHEALMFARSPYSDLRHWDLLTQYDRPDCRDPSPPPAPVETRLLHRRPHSPDTRDAYEAKRSRPYQHTPRTVDTYIPAYSQAARSRRESYHPTREPSSPDTRRPQRYDANVSSPRDDRAVAAARTRVRTSTPPPRGRDGPTPLQEEKRADNVSKAEDVVQAPSGRVAKRSDMAPSPPQPGAPAPQSMNLKGLASAKQRQALLQARLEAEKEEAARQALVDTKATQEQRKAQLAEKLRHEKKESMRSRLLARLEEEKRHATTDAALPGSGPGGESDGKGLATHHEDVVDRENDLRRALEARAAVPRTRIDTRSRLFAGLSDLEARRHALRRQVET